ncbi:DUF6273 domain-containing protein [Candidatus Allofournierella excrementavium]|uniref:DUF6273 domain-containing protein n=1 Tax=Candidatus Allofournierella excrementavium TaxID=2838591 RepID=UPI00374EB905
MFGGLCAEKRRKEDEKQQGGKRNFPAGRLLAALLSLCLLIGLVPGAQTTAFADGTDKAIVPGVAGLNDPVFSNGYYYPSDYIYFGLYQGSPLKWRVLDADKAFDKQTDGVFLLTDGLLETMRYNPYNGSTAWEGSEAQAWCKAFAGSTSNFSAVEQGVMMGIAKTEGAYTLYDDPWGECILSAQNKMFFLSVQEYYDYVAAWASIVAHVSNHFWLRTPNTEWTTNVGVVYPSDGNVGALQTDFEHSARPAFNLDSSAVLFSSPASGGKPDGEISAIGDHSGNEWKLTLKDSSRDGFTIENLHRAGNIITFYYSGAAAGANEYISALVVDSTGAYTHYGRLQPADEAAGTVVFTLPELPEGSTLYIFNEQCNGDYKTDYASHLVELTVPEDTSGAGADGREVELKNDGDSILWRYEGEGDDAWQTLVALSSITGADGKEVQLQVADGYIQWKYDADSDWQNLIAVSALQGMKGDKGDQGEKGEKGELIVTLTDGTELNAGAIPAGTAAPGLEPLVYIALGAAVISLAGMIVMAAYLLAKRKSLLTQA